jgi:hypothetical protein
MLKGDLQVKEDKLDQLKREISILGQLATVIFVATIVLNLLGIIGTAITMILLVICVAAVSRVHDQATFVMIGATTGFVIGAVLGAGTIWMLVLVICCGLLGLKTS